MVAEDTLSIDTGQGIDLNYEIAGVGARAYAFTIDWHIRVFIALGWMLLVLLVRLWTGGPMLLVILPAGVVYVFYHPVVELLQKGNTPGKRRAGVKVLSREGLPPSVIQILIRNVFRMIDSLPLFYGVGIVTCVCNRSSQRLGDLAAGTVLVYREDTTTIADSAALYAGEGLNIGQRHALRTLLDRWSELDAHVQVVLAHRLLAKLGQATRIDDELLLRDKLEKLLHGGQAVE